MLHLLCTRIIIPLLYLLEKSQIRFCAFDSIIISNKETDAFMLRSTLNHRSGFFFFSISFPQFFNRAREWMIALRWILSWRGSLLTSCSIDFYSILFFFFFPLSFSFFFTSLNWSRRDWFRRYNVWNPLRNLVFK